MSWEIVLLGDVIETLKGYAFKSGHYVESGVPIVRASNFTMDSISNDDLKFYTEDEATQFRKYELSTDDVLIQTVGSWESNPASVVGKVVRVPQLLDGALLNQNIVKVFPADKDQLDLQYLFYRLKCHDFKRHNIGNAVGAANQASITLDTIRAFAFLLPNIVEQRRIATILRGYDDLIENNQKQIRLLEEAAQRLYKEWFVDLRFPGHETTPITDGIPEGWKTKTLADIASVVMGQSPKSEFYNQDGKGLPFHQGVGSYGTRFVVDNTFSTSYTRIAEEGSILFSVRAPVGRLNITKNKVVIGRGLAAINHRTEKQSYLFYLLKERFFKDDIIGNGAIFASLSKDELLGQKFLVPVDEAIERFDTIAREIDNKISGLADQIMYLTEARDRLLPKLMNGEIEV